jgi:hypothetical protein
MPSANSPSLDAHEPVSRVTPASRANEARLHRPFITAATGLPISDEHQWPEAVAEMSALVSSSDFSASEDKQQSDSPATMSSQGFPLQDYKDYTVMAPGTVFNKIDGTKLAQIGGAVPSAVLANISGGTTRFYNTTVSNDDPSSSDVNTEQTPASSIVEKGRETIGMSYDEALAFLNGVSEWVDEDILWHFTNKVRRLFCIVFDHYLLWWLTVRSHRHKFIQQQ